MKLAKRQRQRGRLIRSHWTFVVSVSNTQHTYQASVCVCVCVCCIFCANKQTKWVKLYMQLENGGTKAPVNEHGKDEVVLKSPNWHNTGEADRYFFVTFSKPANISIHLADGLQTGWDKGSYWDLFGLIHGQRRATCQKPGKHQHRRDEHPPPPPPPSPPVALWARLLACLAPRLSDACRPFSRVWTTVTWWGRIRRRAERRGSEGEQRGGIGGGGGWEQSAGPHSHVALTEIYQGKTLRYRITQIL